MNFMDQWRAQLHESVIEAAKLVPAAPDLDLKYELLIVGILWPVRQPIQDFDLEAMEAVQSIVGNEQARYILKMIQQWGEDPLASARHLAMQAPRSGNLGAAFNQLIGHFGVFPIFAKQLATQARAASPQSAPQQPLASTATVPPRVFVSYVPTDGQPLAAEVRQRLSVERIPLWPDLIEREDERDGWQQITQALDQVQFLVLIMTSDAVGSESMRRQWRYARQRGVCVYPVFKSSDLNFSLFPRWIRQVHFYNLNFEWPKLINDLQKDCHTPRLPFMVEELPRDFVSRPAELNQLVAHLFDQKREEAIAATVALCGPGGCGKTLLARAVCHDDDIRNVFDNGILWITLGENPGDLIRYVIDLIEILSGERPGFVSLDAAIIRFGELLASRDILLVIDDVWDAVHLVPFLLGGPRCARLVITRNINVLPIDAKAVHIGPMQPSEAVALLGNDLPYAHLDQMRQLADRLGEWPLLLRLANGVLRDRVYRSQQTMLEALAYVNDELDRHGLTAFDVQHPTRREQAISHTLEISLGHLCETEQTRYHELAVFPEDATIPLVTLEKLWRATGGFDEFDVEELCDHLEALSLLSDFSLAEKYIRLHSVMHKYLVSRPTLDLKSLHNQLLDTYLPDLNPAGEFPETRERVRKWTNLPLKEPYLWTHLAYHLIQAERLTELVNTVKDLQYLATKILVRGVHYAENDLRLVEEKTPDDGALSLLRRTLSQAGHLLAQGTAINEITNTLHSRIVHLPELTITMAGLVEENLPRPLLTALHPLPDLPGSALIRTLRSHTSGVLDCAISADGATTVSVAKDSTLIVWDTATGVESSRLCWPDQEIWSCGISADGTTVVAALNDGRLILYDVETKTERLAWQGHQAGIVNCAINADASVVVSASKDKTLKLWDARTGTERFTLHGHQRTVTGCDISADGKLVVSASNDGTLKLWDAQTGLERFTFRMRFINIGIDRLTFFSQRSVSFDCAISADGKTLVGASSGGAITVWEVETGAERLTLTGDKRGIHHCAVNADGSMITCALSNGLLKVWDAMTGAELLTLADHTRSVNSCALNAEGSIIVSASDDRTLKIWDGHSQKATAVSTSHQEKAHSCALSADGTVAVSAMANRTLKVWDVATGAERLTLKGHTKKVNDCAISPDGSTIVSASQDQTLIVWDAQTGEKRLVLTGHTWAVSGCTISVDGSLVVSASDDKTLKLWDAGTGVERFTLPGHTRTVNSCAISADGRTLVSASGDGTLKIWDAHLGTGRLTLTGHTAWVNNCAISAEGKTVASASYDKTIKIWNTHSRTERFTLRGHTLTVTGCALSADGTVVISTSRDKTIKVWSTQTGDCLTTLFVDEALVDCACSADGSTIVAVGNSGIYFLRLEK